MAASALLDALASEKAVSPGATSLSRIHVWPLLTRTGLGFCVIMP